MVGQQLSLLDLQETAGGAGQREVKPQERKRLQKAGIWEQLQLLSIFPPGLLHHKSLPWLQSTQLWLYSKGNKQSDALETRNCRDGQYLTGNQTQGSYLGPQVVFTCKA